MNSTASKYDSIAEHYNLADRFGSLQKSHDCALNQFKKEHLGENRQQFKVLDLGVGDGAFLKEVSKLIPQAELTGIDLSKEMLKKAKENLNFHDIQGDSQHADKYLPIHSQDLVIAHFINAYMPINTLLQQAKWMTKANGYFSYITSTYESFPISQTQLAKFVAEDTFLSSIVGHYYKKIIENTPVASGIEEILQYMHQFGFQIVQHQRISVPIYFANIDDAIEFGIKGTWFLNTLSTGPSALPKKFLIERFKRLFNKIFTFPYSDEHIIDVILAKK
jgi:ubiquinone/menaquinone biosynthesis C-methylase UbiE